MLFDPSDKQSDPLKVREVDDLRSTQHAYPPSKHDFLKDPAAEEILPGEKTSHFLILFLRDRVNLCSVVLTQNSLHEVRVIRALLMSLHVVKALQLIKALHKWYSLVAIFVRWA